MRLNAKAALLFGAAVAAPGWAQQVTPEPPAANEIGDIVVTAQRREQNLQDVPISITALTGESLRANRIVDVRDLNAIAPNFTLRVAAGGSRAPQFQMRGLTTGAGALGADKGISQYIDGVYLQSTNGSIFELANVERIEVLRGPQGTLFGRNATGGAISITTRDPTGEFGATQQLTFGNYDQFRTKTQIDLPKIGPLSASLTYVHSERDGDTRNLGRGTAWDYSAAGDGIRRSPRRLGSQNIDALFAAVALEAGDTVRAVYKYDRSDDDFTPEATGLVLVEGALLNGIRNSQPNQAVLTPIQPKRPKAVNNGYTTPGSIFNDGHNLTVTVEASDALTLKNILAKRRSRFDVTYQLDGFGGLQVTPFLVQSRLAAPAAIGQPFVLLGNASSERGRQWSDEFQANYASDVLDVTAGYLHFDYKVAGGPVGIRSLTQVRAVPNGVIPPVDYRSTRVRVKADAAYAQAEAHLGEKLDLVGGYRYTKDRKRGVDNTAVNAAGASLQLPIRYKDGRSSYLAGINYRPSEPILLYGKYATGFISGGQLAGLAYEPETARSFEAGVKADLFSRRLRSNLAVFHVDYGNQQLQTGGLVLTPPVNASVVLVNVGKARAQGFELENTLLVTRGLTLTGNVGHTDYKRKSTNPLLGAPGTVVDANRPKWTVSTSAEYKTDEVIAGGFALFRVDGNYRSKTRLISTNVSPQGLDLLTARGWIVNGRAALSDMAIGGASVEVAAWGRNVFNNKNPLTGGRFPLGALGTIYGAIYERAPTYGVDLTVRF